MAKLLKLKEDFRKICKFLNFWFFKVPSKMKIPVRRGRKETRDRIVFKLGELEETRKTRLKRRRRSPTVNPKTN